MIHVEAFLELKLERKVTNKQLRTRLELDLDKQTA